MEAPFGSILFVCLGNICRSPMAEAIGAHQAAARGLSLHLDSAGTGAYHAGEPADPRTLAVLRRHGIAYDGRARAVTRHDFARFDLILAMDHANLDALRRVEPPGATARLHLVREPVSPAGEVGDPYYGGPDGFDRVYQQLDEAIGAWLDRIG